MTDITRLIVENGILAVIAAVFIGGSVWLLRAYIKATADFARVMEQSNNIITNHLHDQHEDSAEITKILERICYRLELPNQDYRK